MLLVLDTNITCIIVNALTTLCEKTGADIEQVAKVVGSDSRIGSGFLRASVGTHISSPITTYIYKSYYIVLTMIIIIFDRFWWLVFWQRFVGLDLLVRGVSFAGRGELLETGI